MTPPMGYLDGIYTECRYIQGPTVLVAVMVHLKGVLATSKPDPGGLRWLLATFIYC